MRRAAEPPSAVEARTAAQFSRIVISTRRFILRPSSVELSPMGDARAHAACGDLLRPARADGEEEVRRGLRPLLGERLVVLLRVAGRAGRVAA